MDSIVPEALRKPESPSISGPKKNSWLAGARQALSRGLAAQPYADADKPQQKHSSKITAERYSITHPVLFEELKSMIARGEKDLSSEVKSGGIIDETMTKLRRLQIYKNVFQRYIEECNIYRPVLSAVKYEYDQMLEHYRENFGSVASLHSQLAEKSDRFFIEIKKERSLHSEQMKALVEQRILAQKAMNASKKETLKLAADCEQLKIANKRLKQENDEIKMNCSTLSVAITKFEEERTELLSKDIVRQADFVSMKNALQKAYNEIDLLRQSLLDLEAAHSMLVSHEVLQAYVQTISSMRTEYKTLDTVHKQMIQRYEDLKGAIVEAYAKYDPSIKRRSLDTGNEERLRENPRLIVEKMGELNISPRVILEVLLDSVDDIRASSGVNTIVAESSKAMGGPTTTEDAVIPEDFFPETPWNNFIGLGFDASVPMYLRAEGCIQNIMLSKRDTEFIINEIWIEREKSENALAAAVDKENSKVSGPTGRFEDFFYRHLVNRFKDKNRVVEFAYNFVDALKKYNRDSDIKLFALVLNGEISEEVRNDQIGMVENLKDELRREESMGRIEATGSLSFEGFIRVLKRTFPNKGELSLHRLEQTLLFEINGARNVCYIDILGEDENGSQGKFCELLRAQHLTECIGFSNEVMLSIDQYRNGSDSVTIGRLREALESVDPNKVRAEINRLLARGTGVSIEVMLMTEARETSISVETFKSRLKNGLLKKSNPVVVKK